MVRPSRQYYLREPAVGARYINPFGNVEVFMGWIAPEPKPEQKAIVLWRPDETVP